MSINTLFLLIALANIHKIFNSAPNVPPPTGLALMVSG
jgi:hypothetical protein